jgi:hypothetical protein
MGSLLSRLMGATMGIFHFDKLPVQRDNFPPPGLAEAEFQVRRSQSRRILSVRERGEQAQNLLNTSEELTNLLRGRKLDRDEGH